VNLPQPSIAPLFAVPFAVARLADCAALNRELESLLLSRERDEFRNPYPTHRPQHEMFESDFDLFRWPEACIARLRTFMLDHVVAVAATLNGHARDELARLAVRNHTWFHVTRAGGSFVAHNHPMASWSAVYCVRPGERSAAHPDSGLLRFLDVRGGADAWRDAGNAALADPWRIGARDLRLEAGQLVVFPSYVVHEVTPFHGADTRITVASNCWFEPRR
jgi:uncharacterized protein (TIGR02466 family)